MSKCKVCNPMAIGTGFEQGRRRYRQRRYNFIHGRPRWTRRRSWGLNRTWEGLACDLEHEGAVSEKTQMLEWLQGVIFVWFK
ncbi:hypothetical protein BRADI_2g17908v3 [Brachypodium distachyon]|uniref:Uncharacterized protein n=1 Tax=Brachypodium distachyon TaxID=15368 RepID=A0A2K2D925_BRADI|nr:hypothetical protein BRADI_2g17908v3 [Brachypodium distachyon]